MTPAQAKHRDRLWHLFCPFSAPAKKNTMLGGETRFDYQKEGSMHQIEGRRCQAKRNIRSHQGSISADSRGTVNGEIENLGRRLIAVRWDNGLSMYVFPDEIAIDADPDFESCEVAERNRV